VKADALETMLALISSHAGDAVVLLGREERAATDEQAGVIRRARRLLVKVVVLRDQGAQHRWHDLQLRNRAAAADEVQRAELLRRAAGHAEKARYFAVHARAARQVAAELLSSLQTDPALRTPAG
jgi:hypothetical protein